MNSGCVASGAQQSSSEQLHSLRYCAINAGCLASSPCPGSLKQDKVQSLNGSMINGSHHSAKEHASETAVAERNNHVSLADLLGSTQYVMRYSQVPQQSKLERK